MAKNCLFVKRLEKLWKKKHFVCVGLDSDYTQIPSFLKRQTKISTTLIRFNTAIIDTTHDIVCSYKLQSAFYEQEGNQGWEAMLKTVDYIHAHYPEIPVILDAKRGDIGNTSLAYAQSVFDHLHFDAVTVNPYMGQEALQPFLDYADKGILVLAKTSNPGAGEFQDLPVGKNQKPLYQTVARYVAEKWNTLDNCGVVVGATYPQELHQVRKIVGDMPILLPGIGSQGGETEKIVNAGKDSRGWGMIINSSRGIIFASKERNFAQIARETTLKIENAINLALAK